MSKLKVPLTLAGIFLGLGLGYAQTEKPEARIGPDSSVLDFGAIPDDGFDDSEALRKAADWARKSPGSRLVFPPGEYLLVDSMAIKIQEDAFAGRLGTNPQDSLYRPNQDYVIGMDFDGARDLEIDAKGATLLCDGWMEPLSFRNARNIQLKGLTIDYRKRPNSHGEIIGLGEDYVDVRFPEKEGMTEDMLILRIMVYDRAKQTLVGPAVYHKEKKLIAPNTIRFWGKGIREQAELGRILVTFSGFHYRPAVLVYKTADIVFDDLTIHAQAGMGIVGHLSKNITMNRLRVIPPQGRYISTNTDATHFASNRGFIRFRDSEFAGQGDDATNVHTYYHHIVARPEPNSCETFMGEKNFTHSLYQDEPMVGDLLAVVEKSTLKEVGYLRVLDFEPNAESQRVKIVFDGELPDDFDRYYLANLSASPSLEFVNSKVSSHRARSVLVKTRKVLIENCTFEGTTGTAIHIGAEGNWGEGVASEDVVVRGNRFVNCGLGGENDGTIDGASAVAIHVNAQDRTVPGLHKRILIEKNFVQGGVHAIAVKGARDVTIRHNEFSGIERDPVVVGASEYVSVHGNLGGKEIISIQVPILPSLW